MLDFVLRIRKFIIYFSSIPLAVARQRVRIENNIVSRFDSFATDRSTKEKEMCAEEEDEKSLILDAYLFKNFL